MAVAVRSCRCASHVLVSNEVRRAVVDEATCAAWVRGVLAARAEWTDDFGGEQFSLGRAFYTHFEEGKTRAYFADSVGSDARVERWVPGLQAAMRRLLEGVVAAPSLARRGWCGPGVHVFPAGEKVAREGGVVHFDTEGLADHHLTHRRRAITLVLMLQAPESGGGLRVWEVGWDGRDAPSETELAAPSVIHTYGVGDLVVLDSYRLHQIQAFAGERARISATVHAAETDSGRWETWF